MIYIYFDQSATRTVYVRSKVLFKSPFVSQRRHRIPSYSVLRRSIGSILAINSTLEFASWSSEIVYCDNFYAEFSKLFGHFVDITKVGLYCCLRT